MRKMITFFLILIFVGVLYSSLTYAGECTAAYLNANLGSCYNLEENAFNYIDNKGVMDWTPGSAPTRTAGYNNFGQTFNNDYFDGDDLYENQDFCLSAFMKNNLHGSAGQLFSAYYTAANRQLLFQINADESAQLYIYDNGGGANIATTAILNTTWTMVTGCYEYSGAYNANIYFNGNERASGATKQQGSYAGSIQVGSYNNGAGQFLNADLDLIRLWTAYLNESCVKLAYDRTVLGDECTFNAPDAIDPVVSLIYPDNNTHYNNFNGSIVINSTDAGGMGNCSINNTNWVYTGDDGVLFRFDYAAPDANYSILANCTDAAGNSDNITFNFVVDSVDPTINVFSPLNNSYHNSNILFNVSYFDNFLYKTKTSMPRADNYPDSLNLLEGTHLTGDLNSLFVSDSDFYNISENGGIVLAVNFTNIYNFSEIGINYFYEGNPVHVIEFQIYEPGAGTWGSMFNLQEGVRVSENFTAWAGAQSDYIDENNILRLKINHTSPANNLHYLEIDRVYIISERYYYLNESPALFTNFYNISEYLDISGMSDGNYTALFEAQDTHTVNEFTEEINTETGLTPSGQNAYTKYIMRYGEIEFIYPLGVDLITIPDGDKWRQQYYSLLGTDLNEIEIEILADKIEYFTESAYNCHFILNGNYWFDCVGLIDAEVAEFTPKAAKFKFFHDTDHDISQSLGGLNYVNMTYNINIDTIAPTLQNYTVTNGTTSIKWDLLFNENATYSYIVGLNCSDNSIGSGSGTTQSLSVTNSFLTAATVYYFNNNITDDAGNINTYCLNGTTDAAIVGAINYTKIQEIINEEIERETMNFSVIFGLFAIVSIFAYLGRKSEDSVIKGLFSMFAIYALVVATNAIRVIGIDNGASSNLITPVVGVLVAVMLIALFMTFYTIWRLVKMLLLKLGHISGK